MLSCRRVGAFKVLSHKNELPFRSQSAWIVNLGKPDLNSVDNFVTNGKFQCALAQVASPDFNGAWGFANYANAFFARRCDGRHDGDSACTDTRSSEAQRLGQGVLSWIANSDGTVDHSHAAPARIHLSSVCTNASAETPSGTRLVRRHRAKADEPGARLFDLRIDSGSTAKGSSISDAVDSRLSQRLMSSLYIK